MAQHVPASLLALRQSKGSSYHPGQSMEAHMDFPMVLSIPCAVEASAILISGIPTQPMGGARRWVMVWQS